MCGKNSKPPYSGLLALGSPPRVREKPEPTTPVDKEARITPACAGKTSVEAVVKEGPVDHPRVCGKNFFTSRTLSIYLGSPPRVREKLVQWNKVL